MIMIQELQSNNHRGRNITNIYIVFKEIYRKNNTAEITTL